MQTVDGRNMYVKLKDGPKDDDQWVAYIIETTDDIVNYVEMTIGELVEFDSGLRWEPYKEVND
jgi:hypothetical protein